MTAWIVTNLGLLFDKILFTTLKGQSMSWSVPLVILLLSNILFKFLAFALREEVQSLATFTDLLC